MKETSGNLIPTLCLSGFFLFFAVPGHAFFPTKVDVSNDPELSGKFAEVIVDQWFERKQKILTADEPLGKKELDAMYRAQLDRGIRNIPLLSLLLIRESLRTLDRKDWRKAEFLCQYAKKIAPDFPLAHFTMARIYWSGKKTRVGAVLREYMGGFHAVLRNFRVLFFESVNLVYLISSALLLTCIAFMVIMGLKYVSLYIHDVKREFDLTPIRFLISLLKLFAFVVPVLLNLNLIWTFLYWTILLWGYLTSREKRILVVFLFVLAYVPWALDEAALYLEKPEPRILMSLHQASAEDWSEDTKKRFKKWSQQWSQDPEILFTLGLLNKREGKYRRAEDYYGKVLQYNPSWAECISNLGNVYLITGRLNEAIDHYERAIALSPKQASFYFNLYRAFAKDSVLSSEKLSQALEMANRLDPELVAFQTQIFSENKNRFLIDDTISVGRLWNRLLRVLKKDYGFPEGLLKAWTTGVSGRYHYVYPIFFLVFLLVFAFFCSKRNFSKRCPMCGTPSLRFFTRRIQRDMVCFGCNRLFVKRDSIDPKMREKRMKQVDRFQRRKALLWRTLSLILPGGGHVWKDQSMKGSLFIFISFILGLKFFDWNGIVHDPSALGDGPGFWGRFVFVVFFLLYYLGVLRSAHRIES
jgi:hypothetical protein